MAIGRETMLKNLPNRQTEIVLLLPKIKLNFSRNFQVNFLLREDKRRSSDTETTRMPSSDPLPPKENAIFRKILVKKCKKMIIFNSGAWRVLWKIFGSHRASADLFVWISKAMAIACRCADKC